jgi:hypothetical protein
MGKNQRIVRWLLETATIARVARQIFLSVSRITIWTSPGIESKQFFRLFLSFCHIFLVLIVHVKLVIALDTKCLFILLFFIVPDALFEGFVQFEDPAFYAAQMERLTTLTAIPDRTPLVDWILAYDTILLALR